LSRLRHIAVIAVFSLMGASSLLNVIRALWSWNTTRGLYYKEELDFFQGTAFLLAAVGLIHLDPKPRALAIFLATMSLVTGSVWLASDFGVIPILWISVWVLVLWWLLSRPARTQFTSGPVISGLRK
jgi:hypothetical protein